MEFELNNDFDFNLPNNKINILDDNILFNKSKISDDVLSMSSREDISIADEIESITPVSFADGGGFNCRHEWIPV